MGESAPQVITEYRKRMGKDGKPLSYRKFIDEINFYLRPRGIEYTHVTLRAWETGKFRIPTELFFMLSRCADGWVRSFAEDAMAAIDEDVERRR